jgi:hypothetical protein
LDCKTIGCKWVIRKKVISVGTIEKFKIRFVVKGFKNFKQKANLDFFDTFSPVTRIIFIRLLFPFDLKEIYMDQPEAF